MLEDQEVINIPPEEKEKTTCKWTRDDYTSSWGAECGLKWDFMNDGPTENKMNFCPRCGRKVVV